MKSRLFAILAAALFWSGPVHADPAAQIVPGVSAQTPAPTAPPANGAQTPAPAARREDEPASLSILQRVAAFASGRQRAAENTASLQAKIDTLTQSLSARDATISQLQATISEQTGMLEQIGAWLVDNGHSDPSAVAANPAAAFGDAVGTGVAAAVRTIGIPTAAVPTAPAQSSGPENKLDEIREQIANTKDPKELGRLAAAAYKLRAAN
jgi:pyruvate/2-oxoglutarate dehydrogenase complex dihydrolipoamide acyltransferase (E2) component